MPLVVTLARLLKLNKRAERCYPNHVLTVWHALHDAGFDGKV